MNRKSLFFFFGAMITPCMCFGVPDTVDMRIASGLLPYGNLVKYAGLSGSSDSIKVVKNYLPNLTLLVSKMYNQKYYTTGVWEEESQVYDHTGARTSTQVGNGPLFMRQGVLMKYSCGTGTGNPPAAQIVAPGTTDCLMENNTCAKDGCYFYGWDYTLYPEYMLCRAVYQCANAECGTFDNPEDPICEVEDCPDPTESIENFNAALAEQGKTWRWMNPRVYMGQSAENTPRLTLMYCKVVLQNPDGLCFTNFGDNGYYAPDALVDCDIENWEQTYKDGVELRFVGGAYKYDPGYPIIVPFAKSGNPPAPSLAGFVSGIVCDSGKEFKGVYRTQSTSSDQYWNTQGERTNKSIYGWQNQNDPVYVICE